MNRGANEGGVGGATTPSDFTTWSELKFDSDKVGPDLALCLVFLPKIGPHSAGTMLYCSTVKHIVDLLYQWQKLWRFGGDSGPPNQRCRRKIQAFDG